MGLETAGFITDLQPTWPLGGDGINKGDDHLRLLKETLQSSFPNIAGAMNASHTELNHMVGVTSAVQTQLNSISSRVTTLEGVLTAESGTRVAFHQAAPPVGWTQDATVDDSMLRIVSSSGGGVGGTDSSILNDKVSAHTHIINNAGAHVHNYTLLAPVGGIGGLKVEPGITDTTRQTASAGDHTHIAQDNAGASNWTPKHHDMIIAVAD